MSSKTHIKSIRKHFTTLKDPRIERKKLHSLADILIIAICAVVCGAEEWSEIELFGRAKKKWFKSFLSLPNGIPSKDTFSRVFARLDPAEFQRCFMSWLDYLKDSTSLDIIAIDGKTLRNSFNKASGKAAIHMVSAWSSNNSCVLGQIKVDEKSNEITAVPKLLDILELTDCVVTMDAMGCQKEHATKIISKGGDYILALKGNQGHFHEEVKSFCEDAIGSNFDGVEQQTCKSTEKDHGRIDVRSYHLITDLTWSKRAGEWCGLKAIGIVQSTRKIEDKETKETRMYCTSLNDVKTFARGVRKHWNVENQLHWVLDVAFREDKCRIRKDNAPENFAILRHIALNQLKKENSIKNGIKSKRLKAGWDEQYLLQVLLA
ncbi:MAG: ISAs1 family transposase [Candidatus Riflebacteria bacterium]|nr:ISAs1 family transposase [Candidatus Riflebacteria bacterium]